MPIYEINLLLYHGKNENLLIHLLGTIAQVLVQEIKLFEEYSILANEGETQAQFYLGYQYLKGRGTKQDTQQALSYFQLASSQNGLWQGAAEMALGFIYSTGCVFTASSCDLISS